MPHARWLVALAAACPTAQPTAPPVANHAHAPAAAACNKIHGIVKDPHGQGVPGATLVLTGPSLANVQTAISDDRGAFELPTAPGPLTLTLYYYDHTFEHALDDSCTLVQLHIPNP